MRLSRRGFMSATALSGGAALVPGPGFGWAKDAPSSTVDLQSWDSVRSLFRLAPGWVHAGLFVLSSHPRPVREAVEKMRLWLDENPHDAIEEGAFGPRGQNLGGEARAAIARYIGAAPDEVALTTSTTNGIALAYNGLPLGPGDEILNTAHDHVVHHETVRLVAERCGASTRRVNLYPPHDASAATAEGVLRTLREALSPATRVLGVTWVHSCSGLKLPLQPLAAAVREANAKREPGQRITLLVDGVHGLGADDPRVAETGVDVFVSGLHKWVLAPRGTGMVWARPEVWARMRPNQMSFSAREMFDGWAEGRPPRPPVDATWFGLGGFQAFEHVWAIPAAVKLHEGIGPARVRERILALNGKTREGLAGMAHVRLRAPKDPSLASGLTAFEVDGLSSSDVVRRLRTQKVLASTSPYNPSYPRLSFGIANSEADVDQALDAVRTLR